MKHKCVTLEQGYTVEEVKRGWISKLLDRLEEHWGALKQKHAQKKEYKRQIKRVENAVYQKKKMENDIDKAIQRGIHKAKPFDEKWKEMSEKLNAVGGEYQENRMNKLDDMFTSNNKGGGLF